MTAVRAELCKLLTLPALRWTSGLTWPAAALLERSPADPVFYVQAGFLVFGVLAAASEHQGGGQIRTTLLAMPRRLRLQAAKLVALTMLAVPAAAVTALLAGNVAATAYLTLVTLLGAAVGTLVRNAVAAVVVLLGAQFMAGPVLDRTLFPEPGEPGLTVAWTAIAVTVAAAAFARRDA